MRFGPFEIERPLGRGGMAETFIAYYEAARGFDRRICLKRILPEHAASPSFVAAFEEEAKLAMRLSHPHIAQVYDFGQAEGTLWMSLELVGGGDLRTFLRELGQPMPLELALLLAVDVAAALDYAHELEVDGRPANLVHRDVSPSNVLIDEQGHFKLVDFGIAKWSLSNESTATGTIKGKAAYMAPEQGMGRKVDRRADLWALGVVLFEALAGERPFEGPSDLATMLLVSQGTRKTMKEAAPHVPDAVCQVVERLLAIDPAARYQSASEVIEALERSAAPPTARKRLGSIVRKIQTGEVRSDLPPPPPAPGTPSSPGTLAITALALAAPAPEPVPAGPDDATRTRTVFDAELARSIERGAFDPTLARPASLEPASLEPSVVVSAEVTERTRPAGRARVGLGLALLLAALAVLVGGLALAARAWLVAPAPASSEAQTGSSEPSAATGSTPRGPSVAGEGPTPSSTPSLTASASDAGASSLRALPDASRDGASSVARRAADPAATDRSEPSPSADRARAGARPSAPAPRQGRLEVVVVPWGRVEVDGVDVGRAPYRGSLDVGSHRVAGVVGEERRERTVEVRAGGVTRVSIPMR